LNQTSLLNNPGFRNKKKTNIQRSLQYFSSIFITLFAIIFQFYFRELSGGNIFMFLTPAVFACAAVAGFGPGIIATIITSLSAWYYFVPFHNSFKFQSLADIFGLTIFILMGIIFSFFGGVFRYSRLKEREYKTHLDESNEKLLLANREQSKLLEMFSAAEAKYRGLLESAQDAIIIVGSTGKIEFVNAQVVNWFGYNRVELIGWPIEILIPENLRTIYVEERNKYLEHPVQLTMDRPGLDLNGRRKDGSEFPIDIGLSPSETLNGIIVTAIIRDKTERKKREGQMQFLASASRVLAETFQDEDKLKKMANLAVTEIADGCTVRLFGEDLKLNLAAVVHRDLEKQSIIERLAKAYDGRGILAREISEVLKTQKVQIRNDINKVIFTDLNLKPSEREDLEQLGEFNSAVIPLKANGEVIGILTIMTDKSKRRYEESDIEFLESIGTQVALSIENSRLYNKAQSAIKLREEILAIVSHDLRNPLSTIQLASQLLPKIADDKNKILTFSEKILRSTDQMKRMIEDLMDFAKIQEGNLSIEKKIEEPKVVIDTVFEMMKAQADEKGLVFTLELSPEFPIIKFDKQRIAQALLNLVGNSIKFTESGGHVHISALKSADGGVRFSVTDTGPGISEVDLPKIFDRYWQAQRSKSLSAGLGLSITKGIIEAHGSSITVESDLGKGCTFYFVLPI
jgi:PAS domain S-box-containing protein